MSDQDPYETWRGDCGDVWPVLAACIGKPLPPPPGLVQRCKEVRDGVGESMLHWFAIENEQRIVRGLLELGFDPNTKNRYGTSVLSECAFLKSWDMVRLLKEAGAELRGLDNLHEGYRTRITQHYEVVPDDLKKDAYNLDDLLLPDGPEDASVMTVVLLQKGLPESSIRRPLDRTHWLQFLASHPDFELDDETYEPDSCAQHSSGFDCLFITECTFRSVPRLEIRPTRRSDLRAAHEIATWFGARIELDFSDTSWDELDARAAKYDEMIARFSKVPEEAVEPPSLRARLWRFANAMLVVLGALQLIRLLFF